MKFLEKMVIQGQIKVVTGLHIGGGDAGIEIGGMDNPIIKDRVTSFPYIPGSSLKGKIRSLCEWEYLGSKIETNNGEPCSCGEADCKICRIFGASAGNKGAEQEKALKRGPTRVIFRDCFLTKETIEKFQQGMSITEDKNENSINRITAGAMPRPIERVVPGAEFSFELIYNKYDTDDNGKMDEDNLNVIKKGLQLLEEDYLGGGGSRGSGKIQFVKLKINGKDIGSVKNWLEEA